MELYIVNGYLGSGKTTFVKNFIDANKGKKIAVIANDFGNADVDAELLGGVSGNTVCISGGSVFCACKSYLFTDTVLGFCGTDTDIIIAETSGMANPFSMYGLIGLFKEKGGINFKSSVCLISAPDFEKIAATVYTAKMQAAAADIIYINKCDLAASQTIGRTECLIRQLNPTAKIIRTVNASFDMQELKDIKFRKKALPPNIEEITAQKVLIICGNDIDIHRLNAFCCKISAFAHRIKGFVNFNNKTYLYEYVDGTPKLTYHGNNFKGFSFLNILAITPVDLKEKTSKILNETGLDFYIDKEK